MFIAVYLNKLPIRRFYKIVMFITIYNAFLLRKLLFVQYGKNGGRGVYIILNYSEIFYTSITICN